MPCQSRFDKFFAKYADDNGRVYAEQLGQIAGNVFENGYHGVAASSSLFTHMLGFTGREFLALAGFLAAFGVRDEYGKQYFKIEDLRTMEMEGVFPKDWKKPEQP